MAFHGYYYNCEIVIFAECLWDLINLPYWYKQKIVIVIFVELGLVLRILLSRETWDIYYIFLIVKYFLWPTKMALFSSSQYLIVLGHSVGLPTWKIHIFFQMPTSHTLGLNQGTHPKSNMITVGLVIQGHGLDCQGPSIC